jgi:hypothetical protein
MVHLFDFVLNDKKQLQEFANPNGQVPKFWKGYIALFKGDNSPRKKSKLYSAYWFASNKGKLIKKAILINPNN